MEKVEIGPGFEYSVQKKPWKQKLANFVYRNIFGIEEDEEPTCAVYLKTLFHVLGSLQLMPFRIIRIPENKCYKGRRYGFCPRHFVSKLACMLVQFGGVLTGFWNAYEVTNVKGVAATILSIFSFLSEFSISIMTWRLLWYRKHIFVGVLNSFQLYRIPASTLGKYWKLKICAAVVTIVGIAFVQGYVSVFQAHVINKMAGGTVDMTKKWLLGDCDNPTAKQVFQIFYDVLAMWFYFALRLTFLFEMKIVVMLVYVLNLVGDNFSALVKETKSIDKVVQYLDSLKALNTKVISFCGSICFLLFVLTITNYAVTPAFLRSNSIGWSKYWYRGITLVVHTFTWICAGEFHRKIQMNTRFWIRKKKLEEHLTQIDFAKLHLLANEIENDPVGIGCHHFIVSYGLLTSVVGLLVTYTGFALQA